MSDKGNDKKEANVPKEPKDETREFIKSYIDSFATVYEAVRSRMPKDTPVEILALAVKDTKAALYYREKEKERGARMNATPATPATPQPGFVSAVAMSNSPPPSKMVVDMLNGLDWRDGKNGGQWTFLTNKDGSMVEELRPLQSLLAEIKAAKYKTIDNWKYSISGEGDKFVSRYPVVSPKRPAEPTLAS